MRTLHAVSAAALVALATPHATHAQEPPRARPYVVLVSFDGFRADYLDRADVPNFRRVVRRGVRARSLVPVFPSQTFVNHYTMATGLLPEHHGIVANAFYDPSRGRYGNATPGTVEDGTWYRGEPIWVTAERQGVHAAAFQWLGSEAAIEGVRPERYTRHDESHDPADARMDTVLAWLRLPAAERPHLVAAYVADVDAAGHEAGPDSPEVSAALGRVDRALGRLLDGLDSLPIGDSTYVILVSDHGLATVDAARNYVGLPTLVDTTGVLVASTGANASLHVGGDTVRARALRDSLNRGLRHGRAYLRAEIPARFRYRTDPRIGDVLVVMDEPYMIGATTEVKASRGLHGWDPRSRAMQAIFVVAGPRVRRGATIPAVSNLDLYPFVAELLGLRAAAGIDGRAGAVRSLVMQPRGVAPPRARAGR